MSRLPNGLWYDVNFGESLEVLVALEMRHILFKVSNVSKLDQETVSEEHEDAFQHLMESAKKRSLPEEKEAPKNVKDRMFKPSAEINNR